VGIDWRPLTALCVRVLLDSASAVTRAAVSAAASCLACALPLCAPDHAVDQLADLRAIALPLAGATLSLSNEVLLRELVAPSAPLAPFARLWLVRSLMHVPRALLMRFLLARRRDAGDHVSAPLLLEEIFDALKSMARSASDVLLRHSVFYVLRQWFAYLTEVRVRAVFARGRAHACSRAFGRAGCVLGTAVGRRCTGGCARRHAV
jgi:hypothetical protein